MNTKDQILQVGKLKTKEVWIFIDSQTKEVVAKVKIPEASLFEQIDHFESVLSALEFIYKRKLTCNWSATWEDQQH